MTTTPSTDSLATLCLRSPDALLSAVPYLLGFAPSDSAILLWLRGGRILLTQRMDLPATSSVHQDWLLQAWSHPAAHEADELIVVLVSPTAPEAALVTDLVQHAERGGLDLRDLVWQFGDRWRSLLCSDLQCCPPEGRTVEPSTAAAVAAEFTVLGCAPVADRAALVAELAPVPERVLAVEAVEATAASPTGRRSGARREQWRDDALTVLLEYVTGRSAAAPQASDAARLLSALGDIRVRDTLLWDMAALDADALATAGERLTDLLRAAPAGQVAPVATCCAITAWLRGDGARAMIALDRCAADDPDYSLAGLVRTSLLAGLPPAEWRSAMAGLSRAECRYGHR